MPSNPSPLAPLSFTPILKEHVWGGRALATRLGRPLPATGRFGESWEISGLSAAPSRVADGAWTGRDLPGLAAELGAALLGQRVLRRGAARFPLLFKFLDVRERLSVQVHPPADVAGKPAGKSEAWVVLEAAPGARVWRGLRRSLARADLEAALAAGAAGAAGRLEDCLESFTPRPGDCIPIPAGTLHAAGGGLLLAEVQEPSDLTYRLYDWDRRAPDGSPLRPLHLAEALAALDLAPPPPVVPAPKQPATGRRELWRTDAFVLERLDAADRGALALPGDPGSCAILAAVAGRGRLAWTGGARELRVGTTLLLPAALGEVHLAAEGQADARLTALRAWVP